jgi:hypothetical protein
MALTTEQVRTLELGALGLPPNATADQINARLATVTPGTTIDNRTGLPYTHATLEDVNKGFGAWAGRIIGGLGLGATLGGVAAGVTDIPAAVATGETAGAAGTAATAGGEAGGAGAAASGAGASAGGSALGGNVLRAAKFAAVADFLSYIAWVLHPQTLLRAVEFLLGVFLGAWGIYLLTSRGGGRGPVGATARRIVSLTPAGRTIRMAQGRRMGRREGQREAARMEARQRETLSQRESSARERVRINREARNS